jgi:hypothetical protein
MSTATTRDKYEALERAYRRKVAEIRQNPELSWEKQELKIRELGLKYDKQRKQLEEAA